MGVRVSGITHCIAIANMCGVWTPIELSQRSLSPEPSEPVTLRANIHTHTQQLHNKRVGYEFGYCYGFANGLTDLGCDRVRSEHRSSGPSSFKCEPLGL